MRARRLLAFAVIGVCGIIGASFWPSSAQPPAPSALICDNNPPLDTTPAGTPPVPVATPIEATLLTKAPQPRTSGDSGVEVSGAPDVWVRLSRCCTPVPGDEIIGFVTHGHGVSVHRVDCVNLVHLTETQRERMVDVHWAPTEGSVFLVAIQVEALDRTRLLSDVSRVLSDQHVNILSATVTTSRDRVAFSRFTFEMGDPKHLGHVLRAVRAIDGVYDVYRVTS